MNITQKRHNKRIISNDKLFFATVGRTFMANDLEEKNPILYLNIWINDEDDEDNNGELASLYFHSKRPEYEVNISGNSSSRQHHRISATRLLQLAIFINDLKMFISENPNKLVELRNY